MSDDIFDDPVMDIPSTNTPEIPLSEVEWRVSAVYVRMADAHAVHPVSPEDVHDGISRQIIQGTHRVVTAGEQVNPANIKEFSGVSQDQIDKRIDAYRPMWVVDMDTYVRRIQAEGFRTRALREYRNQYSLLATSPWRDVESNHSIGVQKVTSVRMGGVGGDEDDVGYIFEHMTDKPREEHLPLPFPWPWVNAAVKGGMFEYKKYCFAGPPGHRKTSALFCSIHHAVMVLGKRWVHFPFDGGSVNEQLLKFFVVHWMYLLMKEDIPPVCPAKVLHGGSVLGKKDKYLYVNTIVADKLLYSEETGCQFPAGALDMFDRARADMRRLRAGQGPGLLVMVRPKSVGMDVYRVAQRLRNEMYGRDGLDAWSLDHMGKPHNKFQADIERIPENTRVLTAFTDMEGPPCILVSQLSGDGVKSVGKGKDIDPHLRYNAELWQDADGVFMFEYRGELPEQLKLINQKNRDGRGGPTIQYPLRVQPDTGYIWDDPEWAKPGSPVQRQMRRQKAEEQGEED